MDEREIKPVRAPDAAIGVPGSRSLTNRALVCAALASGESQIEGWLDSDDTRAMRDGLGRLGVEVSESNGALHVNGLGGRFAIPLHPIDCGASGTTMRFLTACAARVAGRVVLDGTARMRERPIQELADALNRMGARVTTVAGCPPLTVQGGTLRGGQIGVDASRSSQFLSALLLVAPLCSGSIELLTGDVTSRLYVDMTLDVMNAFGVAVQTPNPRYFVIPAPQSYRARRYRVEPDASSASYFFAAAAITGGRIRVEGLTPASSQADVRFIEVLERMGCSVERGTRSISVRGPRYLHGIDVDMNVMPDAAITLAVTACFAQGVTRIRNVANLRLKESDRMQALQSELGKLGARVTVSEKDIEIEPPKELRGARIRTYDDHRIAMSFAIAGLRTPGIVIQDPDCVSKTFPDFFERLAQLG
jgi:3-phosphoshikimate 1-carboxyvinyltransferase